MPDLWSDPEKLGLENVAGAGDGLGYEYSMFDVWRDDEGNLYYASDSGCSCDYPYSWFNEIAQLTKAESIQEIHDALDEWAKDQSWMTDEDKADVVEAHAKLAALTARPTPLQQARDDQTPPVVFRPVNPS